MKVYSVSGAVAPFILNLGTW